MTSLESWHFAKTISFSNVLTTVMALVAIVIWIVDIQERVGINEYKIGENDKQVEVVRNEVQTMGAIIMSKLDTIEARQYELTQKRD